MKKIFRISAGIGLILVGIVGLILPIMPGWVFIIPGLVILADYSPRIRRVLEWARQKVEGVRSSATMKDRPDPGK